MSTDPKKRITPWAATSLAASILGWLVGLPLLFINYSRVIGATAGVGLFGPFLIGMVSGTLCLLALIFGVVALAKSKSDQFCGRGIAWAGGFLGGLGLAAHIIVSGRYLFGWW